MRAITTAGYGDANVLGLTEREPLDPGHGEVWVAVEAADTDFVDVVQPAARRYVEDRASVGKVVLDP